MKIEKEEEEERKDWDKIVCGNLDRNHNGKLKTVESPEPDAAFDIGSLTSRIFTADFSSSLALYHLYSVDFRVLVLDINQIFCGKMMITYETGFYENWYPRNFRATDNESGVRIFKIIWFLVVKVL